MGAEQSSQRSAAQAEATPQKTCYYELLSCERTATDDELKKAYRRKALELHPDRNFNDVENATRKFAEVQTAYEILSDPQERAWYDSHRDDILRGDSGANGDDGEGGGGGAGPRYYNNVRLTPAEDLYKLMGRFNSSVPFDDSPYGFFGILEATFAQLALEEEAAFNWDTTRNASDTLPTYHPFGSANENYDAVAKPFYKDWSNFSTVKSFSWKDKYRLSDAPDRQVRRMMEKDNKKAREQGIRDFNDAVRSLVAFVRKRDPRYIPNMQSEAERQQVLRDSANAQAQRQRAANQEKRRQMQEQAGYVEPGTRPEETEQRIEVSSSEEEDEPNNDALEEIECVVCDKTFKSEKQFEAHERSRKHVKAVQTLKWQMRKQDKALNLDEYVLLPPRESNETDNKSKKGKKNKKAANGDEENEEGGREEIEAKDDKVEEEDEESNDEYAPRHVVESRFKAPDDNGEDKDDEEEDDSDNEFAARMKKLSLKKQKKKKKQMKQMGFFDQEEQEEDEEEDDKDQQDEKEKLATKEEEKSEKAEKIEKADDDEKEDSEPTAKMGKAKARREKRAAIQAAAAAAAGENEGVVACTMCRKTFSSNTKLHQHLRSDHTAAKGKGKKKK